jgi:molybdopterin-guanine dinucleotide biosynthesis protein B
LTPTVPSELPICLLAGQSESGKTTLLVGLLQALKERGVVCATVKHHRGRIEVDQPGKDTWRHRRAGAKATFFVTETEIAAFFDRPPEVTPSDLARLCPPEVRLLLVEGFKGLRGYPRIEVVRRGFERTVAWAPDVLAVATDVPGFEAPCPVVPLDGYGELAELLIRTLLR